MKRRIILLAFVLTVAFLPGASHAIGLCDVGAPLNNCLLRCDDPRAAPCGTGYACNSATGYCDAISPGAVNGTAANATTCLDTGCPDGQICKGNPPVCETNTATCNPACSGSTPICNQNADGSFSCISALQYGNQSVPTTPGASSPGGINLAYLQGYKESILTFINGILAPILISVAFIFFLWSIYKYFIQGANEPKERETGRTFAMYAIVGFAVIFSLWGLVNLVTGTFNFGVGGTAASHGLTPPTL